MEASQIRRAVLCLGAPRVEFVRTGEAFVPRAGGCAANVALVAARAGVPTGLAGVVGDDEWGAWLRTQLSSAGVDVSPLAADGASRIAFVRVDGDGAVRVSPHGVAGPALAGVDLRVAEAAGLFVGAETLVGAEDRELTMRARSVALEHDVPLVFAPALRLADWRSAADAAASLNAVVPGALLVCVTAVEATVMTGEEDVERAAVALVKAGARLVVIVLESEGAMLRGELRADVETDAVGPSDVLAGTLLARLAASNFYPPVVAASLREAVAAAVQAGHA